MTKELTWMYSNAKITKEYPECITKTFSGKLPYRMVMNAIRNNEWTNKSEGGQGRSSFWNATKNEYPIREYSLHYNCYTKILTFTINEAR